LNQKSNYDNFSLLDLLKQEEEKISKTDLDNEECDCDCHPVQQMNLHGCCELCLKCGRLIKPDRVKKHEEKHG